MRKVSLLFGIRLSRQHCEVGRILSSLCADVVLQGEQNLVARILLLTRASHNSSLHIMCVVFPHSLAAILEFEPASLDSGNKRPIHGRMKG